jgi:hypothetical protein
MARFWIISLLPAGQKKSVQFRAAHVWKLNGGFAWVTENNGMDGVHHGHVAKGNFVSRGRVWTLTNSTETFTLEPFEIDAIPHADERKARKYLCDLNDGIESEIDYVDLETWASADFPRLQIEKTKKLEPNPYMVEIKDLLTKANIPPERTLVVRHKPHEPKLRRIFTWLAIDRPDLINAYQRFQTPNAESALSNADYLVSFIGHEARKALFFGLFEIQRYEVWPTDRISADPQIRELVSMGMVDWSEDSRREIRRFDLVRSRGFEQWLGRLEVHWPGLERSWYRWVDRNDFVVSAIHSENILQQEMPPWTELVLTWRELAALPKQWIYALQQWRGIYYIHDTSDGKGYVGSAYGQENIYGRWKSYAETGHGGNKELKGRDPRQFVFSVLERLSPDMLVGEVIHIENNWKSRLHTRTAGLNSN